MFFESTANVVGEDKRIEVGNKYNEVPRKTEGRMHSVHEDVDRISEIVVDSRYSKSKVQPSGPG